MEKLKITVPYKPPSVNTYWRKGKNGIIFLSEKGREFKQNVADYVFWECDIPKTPVFPSENLKVSLILNFKDKRKKDIDNFNKGIFDALSGILWADDSQIGELNIIKNNGTGKADNFILEVEEIKK